MLFLVIRMGKSKNNKNKLCSCYYEVDSKVPVYCIGHRVEGLYIDKKVGHCNGTKNREECYCKGKKKDCSFYEYRDGRLI